MLVAWILSLLNPAPLRLRRRGYVRESGLLHARARRCRGAWAPHLARARAAVTGAVAACGRRRLAVVLGSGLLDDVPLHALAAAFDAVHLVDAVHPWPTRIAVWAHPNVVLATAEISAGLADEVLRAACAGADLVVSANLLSQLPILPVDAYEARGGEAPPRLGSDIVAAHLAALDAVAARGARVCLITDTVQREEDRAGRVTDTLDLLHGVPLPAPAAAWDWEIAPFGEAARHRRLIHRVHAYPDWGAARGQG
ncbi:hypothetical protein Q8W71_07000 [Methylobacterium sp. NEAU 140]|uniref:hypothetical protein n=1 Tax=Methylobacterium sp. NEAU 140 TaxID=3064945 RepID=UPI00273725AB|nr:hypothetical protein [Methylobacterium sp. NEAU 140]MDP4022363.1 hypothetical protein [Methylobacterium sp. NEAU 140]